jgi:hypothetical protein
LAPKGRTDRGEVAGNRNLRHEKNRIREHGLTGMRSILPGDQEKGAENGESFHIAEWT